jgi:hypothetical protein
MQFVTKKQEKAFWQQCQKALTTYRDSLVGIWKTLGGDENPNEMTFPWPSRGVLRSGGPDWRRLKDLDREIRSCLEEICKILSRGQSFIAVEKKSSKAKAQDWQAKEDEADEDIARGRVKSFRTVEALIRDLHCTAKEMTQDLRHALEAEKAKKAKKAKKR